MNIRNTLRFLSLSQRRFPFLPLARNYRHRKNVCEIPYTEPPPWTPIPLEITHQAPVCIGDTTPVSETEFAGLMQKVGISEDIGIFGLHLNSSTKSLVLAKLVMAWGQKHNTQVEAIVTHSEALEDSKLDECVKTLRDIGLIVHVFRPPHADNQQLVESRVARFDSFRVFCIMKGLSNVLTEHCCEDGVEHFFVRFSRNGVGDRMAGFLAVQPFDTSFKLLRPLLYIPESRIRATASQMGMDWHVNPDFSFLSWHRDKVKSMLPDVFRAVDITYTDVLSIMGRFQKLCQWQDHLVASFFEDNVNMETFKFGYISIHKRFLAQLSPMTGVRAFYRLLLTFGDVVTAPRFSSYREHYANLFLPDCAGTTIQGCQVTLLVRKGTAVLTFYRENKETKPKRLHMGLRKTPFVELIEPYGGWQRSGEEWAGATFLFENRYWINVQCKCSGELPAVLTGAVVMRANADLWRRVCNQYKRKMQGHTDVPLLVRHLLPIFLDADGVVLGVPHFNISADPSLYFDVTFATNYTDLTVPIAHGFDEDG